jgi:hypothetical protein
MSRFRIISLKGNRMQTAHGESDVGGTNNAGRLRRQSQWNFHPCDCRGQAIQQRANEDSNPNSLARKAAARMATAKSPARCRRYKCTPVTRRSLEPDQGRSPELFEGPLVTSHCNSNRHKHGLEMPVTPCAINKIVVSNRHRFGHAKSAMTGEFGAANSPNSQCIPPWLRARVANPAPRFAIRQNLCWG